MEAGPIKKLFLAQEDKVEGQELSETHRRSIPDRHFWLETHRGPTCLIGDPLKTDMLDQACPVGLRLGKSVFDGNIGL